MNQLENKVALVTGGASRPGLGSAIADKFASEGAFVFLTDIDENGCIESLDVCLLYTSPSPRDATLSRMPSSA